MSAGPSNRQDLIQNAILFLQDPKVQTSTLASKISFLESKGLNDAEIQESLGRAALSSPSSTSDPDAPGPSRTAMYGGGSGYMYGNGYGQMMAPEPPRRDWRDMFIMAVISGGVVYGLTALARKYLLPHLQPPSSTSFQQTSQDLSEQYDQASQLLSELSDQHHKLQESLESDREKLNGVVEEVKEAIKSVRDGEERWREEMRDVRGEVDSVRELVPRMIEKHAAAQSSALSDLQMELRSLKTLLQSRQAAWQASSSSTASPPPQSLANGRSNGTNGNIENNGLHNPSPVQHAANALLTPKGTRGIPAWQLPAKDQMSNGDGTSSVSERETASSSNGQQDED